jgi:transposase
MGWKRAGENVRDLLKRRSVAEVPLRMGDALNHNWICKPGEIGKRLTHARRTFVEIEKSFPEHCGFVLNAFGKVFGVEREAKEKSDAERLEMHQTQSRPVMDDLMIWIEAEEKAGNIEPSSGLGKAVNRLKTHWRFLTQFLRIPGMPLENDTPVITHRRNSLFYKTTFGATVGDILMSLIETCRMNRVNALAYLTALGSVEKSELWRDPAHWLPWTYAER